MKISLVFDDWRKDGKSVYSSQTGLDLSMGDYHSGSTFPATIELDKDQEQELIAALNNGFRPTFWIGPVSAHD